MCWLGEKVEALGMGEGQGEGGRRGQNPKINNRHNPLHSRPWSLEDVNETPVPKPCRIKSTVILISSFYKLFSLVKRKEIR